MRTHTLIIIASLCGTTAFAQGAFELEARLWQPDLTATVRSIEGAEVVDPETATIDLKGDLAMADDDFYDYRLTMRTGERSRLRLAFTTLEYAGDAQVNRTVEFNGETYTVGTRVVSALQMDYYRLGWVWQFVGNDRARLGAMLEAKGVEIDASLAAPELEPAVDERESLSAIFPTVGFTLDLTPGRYVHIFAEVSGITGGDKGHFVDGEVGVRLTLLPYLTVVGGWRLVDMELEDEPDFASLEDEGPFFGLGLTF